MKEYNLLKNSSATVLNNNVNGLLKEGWQLYGSPFSVFDGKGVAFCQAMVKELNESEESKMKVPAMVW